MRLLDAMAEQTLPGGTESVEVRIPRLPVESASKQYDLLVIGGGIYGVALAFEALSPGEWQELEELLDRVLKRTSKAVKEPPRGERIAALYRRACEHLALARARSVAGAAEARQ